MLALLVLMAALLVAAILGLALLVIRRDQRRRVTASVAQRAADEAVAEMLRRLGADG